MLHDPSMDTGDKAAARTIGIRRNFRVHIRILPGQALVPTDMHGRSAIMPRNGIARLHEIPLPGEKQPGNHLMSLVVFRNDQPGTRPRCTVVTALSKDYGKVLPSADHLHAIRVVNRTLAIAKQRSPRQVAIGNT